MEELSFAQQKGLTAFQTVTGQHPGPAIACCVIFGLFGVISIVNWCATRYKWYEILTMGAVFRAIAYACKASALYRPQAKVEATFMTLINSGLGATIAVMCISLGNWFRFKEGTYFSARTEAWIKWCSFLLCFPLIVMGIGAGIAGSVLVYSGFGIKAIGTGYKIRMAGSISLCCVNAIINILLAVTTVRVYTRVPEDDGRYYKDHIFNWRRRNTKMVILLLLAGLLLQVRSVTGVLALFYSSLWANDLSFYLLDGFPEMLALTMLSVPTLLARCAQCWPPRMRAETAGTKKLSAPSTAPA